MPAGKPKAYSYIRFSTPEQARGDSLRRQTAAAAAWCAERGLELDNTLRDLGVSAYRGANRSTGALRRFLELVETGQVERGSYLIVESLDRLSREAVYDASARLLDLIRAGIRVVTLSDGQEYSDERLRTDWTPLVISLAVMARAHEESRMKSERVGAAWKRKKAAARASGAPITPRCPEWLSIEAGRFVVREDRAGIVRRIFQDSIAGFGQREIVKRLNSAGIPAFRSKQGWQTSSISKILRGRAVLGEYQPHSGTHKAGNRKPDGEPIPDYYPAVVDEGTYWRAQAAIQGRRAGRVAGRHGKRNAHVLRGLAKCGCCGSSMAIEDKGPPPKGGVYLVCSSSGRRAGCSNMRRWRVRDLERRLLIALGYCDATAYAPLDEATPVEAERVAALRGRLTDAEERRKRLLRLAETGDEEAESRFAEVAAEVKALRKDLKKAEADASEAAADPGMSARLTDAAALVERMAAAGADELHDLRIRLGELLRGLVERVECHEYGAVMLLKPRLFMRHSGKVPFAFRHIQNGPEMLIEDDAPEQVIWDFMVTEVEAAAAAYRETKGGPACEDEAADARGA